MLSKAKANNSTLTLRLGAYLPLELLLHSEKLMMRLLQRLMLMLCLQLYLMDPHLLSHLMLVLLTVSQYCLYYPLHFLAVADRFTFPHRSLALADSRTLRMQHSAAAAK
jgi:hypothetical protein